MAGEALKKEGASGARGVALPSPRNAAAYRRPNPPRNTSNEL